MSDYNVTPYLTSTSEWNIDDKAFLKRYYTLYYKENIYVRQSPNKICILGHISPPKNTASVKFNLDLIGEKLKPDSLICEFLDVDHKVLETVYANMDGKLLELHKELSDNPELLINRSLDLGFLAVIMPRYEDSAIQLHDYVLQ